MAENFKGAALVLLVGKAAPLALDAWEEEPAVPVAWEAAEFEMVLPKEG